jgi:hypothetical protein
MNDRWHPIEAKVSYAPFHRRPEVGEIVAFRHAAWTVTDVRDSVLRDGEHEALARFSPEFRKSLLPYAVTLRHLYGPTQERQNDIGDIGLRIWPASRGSWRTYKSGRVPLCSCCGHPWPCRMLVAEEESQRAAEVMSGRMDRTMPGCCYGCGEPITSRQKSVRYPEPNVQVPGSPAPTFHMRQRCFVEAWRYERDRARLHPAAQPLATDRGWVLPDADVTVLDDDGEQL